MSACPRIVKRRDGTKTPCGLSAVNEHEGTLYCKKCFNLVLKQQNAGGEIVVSPQIRAPAVSQPPRPSPPAKQVQPTLTRSPAPVATRALPTPIKEFVVNGRLNLSLPCHSLVLGGSMAGKSTVIRGVLKDLLRQGKVGAIFWFGQNCDQEEAWLPKEHRHRRVDENLITQIREMQKAPANKDYQIILVLDDVVAENFHRSMFYQELIAQCRHERVSLIFGLHYALQIPPLMRLNVTTYIVCDAAVQTQQALYKLSSGGSFTQFQRRFKPIVRGKPIVMDTRAGGKIHDLRYPVLEPSEMDRVKFV